MIETAGGLIIGFVFMFFFGWWLLTYLTEFPPLLTFFITGGILVFAAFATFSGQQEQSPRYEASQYSNNSGSSVQSGSASGEIVVLPTSIPRPKPEYDKISIKVIEPPDRIILEDDGRRYVPITAYITNDSTQEHNICVSVYAQSDMTLNYIPNGRTDWQGKTQSVERIRTCPYVAKAESTTQIYIKAYFEIGYKVTKQNFDSAEWLCVRSQITQIDSNESSPTSYFDIEHIYGNYKCT